MHTCHNAIGKNVETLTYLPPLANHCYILLLSLPFHQEEGTQFQDSCRIGWWRWRNKKGGEEKIITREQEPEQYWQTAGEREGENPMMTPLPYIIIFGMSTPFVILAIAFANGWVKVPVR
ncbi:uncharacterized protein Pyn_26341 [Prunus yedoensis var. nudiflora]|uniref:Uncharacterized protein n=1 Tax=Prunus yedoensis var. nudiflora TaxID=2094558 RepID=A0A314ZLC2_PRUYE|nr:uncharacterized protein Pyn_26341 [Prunus yedoensis var. nudiflora]